jgi:hypothetical protein
MTAITKDIRRQMVNAVVKHRYEAEGQALLAQEQALTIRLHGFLVPPKLKEAMAKVIEIEPEAFVPLRHFGVRVNGMTTTLHLDPLFTTRTHEGSAFAVRKKYAGDPLWLTAKTCGTYINVNDVDAKLAEDMLEYMQARRKMADTIDVAAREAAAAFNAMPTVKKLRDNWPEVIPLVEALLPSPANRNVPSVPVVLLNAKFGLPPETEAA